jgi:vacuolar-type H+-ATPase subunit F/Vma7
MPQPVYIGDEVDAAGYRLAGVQVYTPDAGMLREALRAAGKTASLIMLSARLAGLLPVAELEHLQSQIRPALLVVPDLSRGTAPPDLASRLRRALGLLE